MTVALFIDAGVGSKIGRSADAVTWTVQDLAFDDLHTICWSDDLELLVAAGLSEVLTSPDGITWTQRTNPHAGVWRGSAWSPALGLFVIVGGDGSNDMIATSPDGVTWTDQTVGTYPQLMGVSWSPTLGLFCAVGRVGAGGSGLDPVILTSADGVTWTDQTPNLSTVVSLNAIAWSEPLGMWAAVGNILNTGGGTFGCAWTSADGVTWSRPTSPTTGVGVVASEEALGIVWNDDVGEFCAVAQFGRVIRSSDGVTWTLEHNGLDTHNWRDVAWSPDAAIYAAVADGGFVMSSPDGSTWQYEADGFGTDNIYAIIWTLTAPIPPATGSAWFVSASIIV